MHAHTHTPAREARAAPKNLFEAIRWKAAERGLAPSTIETYEQWVRAFYRYFRRPPHLFRHAFAQHLLRSGTDIRIIQTFLGHKSVETTMAYTGFDRLRLQVASPLGDL